ncbi:Rtr1/RPAP2 family-domain-containing protein [Xylariomycetidae sp. FL2044]|nr:Rtr1/RPAP2 family-domain-containing protein [Xylariomycetidae sp. FL2044]
MTEICGAPKGILKKTRPSVVKSEVKGNEKATKPDPREVAIQHARIIHSRREVEDQISDSMIELAKFPLVRDPPHNASAPAPSDAEAFRQLVRLYQPSDYDDLIEERNANKLCGYALCPNRPTKLPPGGTFKLMNYGTADFNIVPRKEIEKWCGRKCAKRAMYVKVQLNETAAWERAGISSIQIDLFEEHEKELDEEARVAKDLENLKIEAEKKSARDARDLALERGDTKETESSKRSVDVTIREKKVKMAVAEPTLADNADSHLALDGYRTKFDPKSETISNGTNIAQIEEENTEG